MIHTLNSNRMRSDSNDRLSVGHRSTLSSGQQSPLVSGGMDMEALMQQRMENLQASMQNQGQSQQSIGVAN